VKIGEESCRESEVDYSGFCRQQFWLRFVENVTVAGEDEEISGLQPLAAQRRASFNLCLNKSEQKSEQSRRKE
jgi:hypothetical protein